MWLVFDLKPRDHATPALRELHWLPIAQQIEYKLCLLVYKTFVGHTPDYISDLLTPVADIPTRSLLRASSNGNLFLPRTERRFGDRAFSVAVPCAWNRLPTELNLMRSSTTTFNITVTVTPPRTRCVILARCYLSWNSRKIRCLSSLFSVKMQVMSIFIVHKVPSTSPHEATAFRAGSESISQFVIWITF